MARIEANNEREATPKAAKQNPSKARTTNVASCHDDGRPSPRRENMMSDMEEEETKTSNGATFFSLLEKLQLLYIVFIAVGGASEGTRSKRKLKQTRPTRPTRPTMSSALMLVAVVAAMFMTVYVPRGVVAAVGDVPEHRWVLDEAVGATTAADSGSGSAHDLTLKGDNAAFLGPAAGDGAALDGDAESRITVCPTKPKPCDPDLRACCAAAVHHRCDQIELIAHERLSPREALDESENVANTLFFRLKKKEEKDLGEIDQGPDTTTNRASKSTTISTTMKNISGGARPCKNRDIGIENIEEGVAVGQKHQEDEKTSATGTPQKCTTGASVHVMMTATSSATNDDKIKKGPTRKSPYAGNKADKHQPIGLAVVLVFTIGVLLLLPVAATIVRRAFLLRPPGEGGERPVGDSGVVPSRAPPSLVGSKPRNPPDGATQRRAAAAFGAALLYPRLLLLLLLSVVTMMVGGVAGVKITEHSCYTGLDPETSTSMNCAWNSLTGAYNFYPMLLRDSGRFRGI